jgi:ATP-binding cassette, subfamily B, bacterial
VLFRKTSKAKRTIDRQTFHIFWQAGLKHRRLLVISLLFPLGLVLSNVIAPLFISKTLGALVTPTLNPLHFLWLFAVAAALGLASNRVGHPALMSWQVMVMRDVQVMALTTLLRRGVGFHNNNIGGKLVSDAIDYPNAYGRLADSIATSLMPLGITLVIGSAVIYTESWLLGLFVTGTTMLIVGLGVYDSYRMAPRRQARMEAGKAVTAHLADTVTNIATVKTFSHEDQELSRHGQLGEKLKAIRLHDFVLMSKRGNNRLIILVTLQFLLVYQIVQQVQQNPALLGVGIFAFAFTVTLSNRLFEINLLIRNIEEGFLQASPMTKIILETPEIQDRPDAKPLVVAGGGVQFSNVTFSYADTQGKEVVFDGLTLTVRPGEKVGLVGPSGGGKSTLTRLLLRFEDINGGEITIDGQNIAAVTQESLRQAISYVPQEPLLFHRTIAENIAYGRSDAGLSAVKRAAAMAHADGFIEKLQDAYETVVGERGVKLSGGQRQRIAIARAILKDAPLLLLDEATSALDSESEVLIQDALWRLMEGRTTMVIAHRLSTIQKMDRIVVLDEGRIVEQGTHQQLLGHKGLYAKLWSHQSGGFMDGEA